MIDSLFASDNNVLALKSFPAHDGRYLSLTIGNIFAWPVFRAFLAYGRFLSRQYSSDTPKSAFDESGIKDGSKGTIDRAI